MALYIPSVYYLKNPFLITYIVYYLLVGSSSMFSAMYSSDTTLNKILI